MSRGKATQAAPACVGDLMSRYVEIVRPRATAQEAAARMRAFDIGSLPVCENGEVVGILTDRDITLRVTAAGRKAGNTLIEEVMSRGVAFCWPQQMAEDAARVMQMNRVRRLPVVDEGGHLQGMITLADLARAGFHSEAGRVLCSLARPIQASPAFASLR